MRINLYSFERECVNSCQCRWYEYLKDLNIPDTLLKVLFINANIQCNSHIDFGILKQLYDLFNLSVFQFLSQAFLNCRINLPSLDSVPYSRKSTLISSIAYTSKIIIPHLLWLMIVLICTNRLSADLKLVF